jgi:hypothetical protein
MRMSWRGGKSTEDRLANVYDAVLLLEVIGRVKRRVIHCLIGRAGEDDAGARGPDGTFLCCPLPGPNCLTSGETISMVASTRDS